MGGNPRVKSSSSKYRASCPTEEKLTVCSVVGAGDTFIAGMLYGENVRRSEWSLKEKLVLANELAGRKVLQEGFVGLGDALEGGLP
jgi:fructose-1-phosphate kinase PfkB-like protein